MFLVSFPVVNTRLLPNVSCSPSTFFPITTSRIASELQYFMNMWLIPLVCSKERKMGVGKLKIYLGEREHSVHHPLPPFISCNFMLLLYPSQNKTKQHKNSWSPLCTGWLWMSYLPLNTANRTGVSLYWKKLTFLLPSAIKSNLAP